MFENLLRKICKLVLVLTVNTGDLDTRAAPKLAAYSLTVASREHHVQETTEATIP